MSSDEATRSAAPWADWVLARLEREPCALISLLAAEGSTPREAGTRMAVAASGIFGTIGGGNLEFQAIEQGRRILAYPPGTWRIQDYPLGPLLGQCCGGRARVLIERLDEEQKSWLEAAREPSGFSLRTELLEGSLRRSLTAEPPPPPSARGPLPKPGEVLFERLGKPWTQVTVFGAGHVGKALARLLADLPFRLDWMDERPESPPPARILPRAALCEAARAAQGPVLILTHDHALDYELVRAALASPSRFVGLIGSQTKRARFLSRLRAEGFPEEDLARVVCPIGLPEVKGKAPEIVAISAAAQLLSLEARES